MSSTSFEIVRFTAELGSSIPPQFIYNTPTGQIQINLAASICCHGPQGETLEILFPREGSAPLENRSGSITPVSGTVVSQTNLFPCYAEMLRYSTAIAYIDSLNPKNNRVRADAFAKAAHRKARRADANALAQKLKFEKLTLKTLKIELDHAEESLRQSQTSINEYIWKVAESRVDAQNAAIAAAEAQKFSADEDVSHF